ncbi:MAG: beta-ketoacyl synthase chain length factor [Halioglobus sp.]|nr:beta-ketoacyl synthase chain length factor [Halioglobus sp.]
MNSVYVESVGLFAPGLNGWANSTPVLRGEAAYVEDELPRYRPTLLSGNERRRATDSVRIAFGAGEDAVHGRLDEAARLASVFVSSGGDYRIHDQICRGLLKPEKHISPTLFHNSVHNAPAGYWSIATGSAAPSVSLCAYDYSVAAGLLEATSLAFADRCDVLLVLSDSDVSEPLVEKRPVTRPFAAALWLAPQQSDRALARLTVSLSDGPARQPDPQVASLGTLCHGNPAARVLPLLEVIARSEPGSFNFPLASGGAMHVHAAPVDRD